MSNRNQLITVEQFRELARPMSAHLDEGEVNSYIREAEDAYIIPAIGYANFKATTQGEKTSSAGDGFEVSVFSDGGEWKDDKDNVQYCNGLRKALAYFTYAKMIRSDGAILSRAGNMRHRDDYGDHVDDSKLKEYNDIMSMAESYLNSAMLYLKNKSTNPVQPIRGTRSHIYAIGD